MAAGPAWRDTGLVFTTEIGTMLDPSNLRHDLSRIATAAGLGHWRPHELRHTANSIMAEHGVSPEKRAQYLGHSPRVNSEVYLHPIVATMSAGVGPMEAVFGESREESA
jgi:integrase